MFAEQRPEPVRCKSFVVSIVSIPISNSQEYSVLLSLVSVERRRKGTGSSPAPIVCVLREILNSGCIPLWTCPHCHGHLRCHSFQTPVASSVRSYGFYFWKRIVFYASIVQFVMNATPLPIGTVNNFQLIG